MISMKIYPPSAPVSGMVELPFSKSIANRLLIMKSLSGESLNDLQLSNSEDTVLLHKILSNLSSHIDASDAGTVFRFLTAFLSVKPGIWNLTGSARMLNRPIGPLVEALRLAGAEIGWLGKEGYPPMVIRGKQLIGGMVTIDPSMSSQFVSAMLMIGPYMKNGLTLVMTKKPSSFPYIQMTVSLMNKYGVDVKIKDDSIRVEPGKFSTNVSELEEVKMEDWHICLGQ